MSVKQSPQPMNVKALKIVTEAFSGKKDRGGKPYIDHLRRVAQSQPCEVSRAAGWLHDLVEDIEGWTEKRLREEFPEEVCDIVMILTKDDNEDYGTYIDRVENAQNPKAIGIKLADLRDNMDITRLQSINVFDICRLKKYHAAYIRLKKHLIYLQEHE